MPFTFENLPKEYEQLQVPVFILKATSTANSTGLIKASSDSFPDQYYEVTKSYFKLYLHLSPGINKIRLTHLEGCFQPNGFAGFNASNIYDNADISINFSPISDKQVQVPKIHMCVMVARDSPMLFDCPQDKLYEGNMMNTAIKKLRVGGRLMQAFTQDEMAKNSVGNRCFRFVEDENISTISYQEELAGKKRSEIKIHILKSKRSVAEIRDADVAQQNPKAKEAGKLFDYALEALKEYGGEFSDSATSSTPAIASVLIMDAHWDRGANLIRGHAALGGGTDRIKLAIFGSQGLHSWPMNWESIHKCFTDCTPLNINEVANDCNECGQYWECLCVSLGAFMHEIGHALGCPHQERGVMLRDYTAMNRKFLTYEMSCIRTRKGPWGPVLTKDEPGWHRLDVLRFLYHPAFALPTDFQDQSFRPQFTLVNKGMKLPEGISGEPTFQALDGNTLDIYSDSGVYLVECHVGEWSRIHFEYLPKSYNAPGPQKYIRIQYSMIQNQLAPQFRNKPVKLEVLSLGFGQRSIDDLKNYLSEHSQMMKLSNNVLARKSDAYGNGNSSYQECIFPAGKKIAFFRVTHGLALDGIETHFTDGSRVAFGNTKPHYTDFKLDSDEVLIAVLFSSGGWVDSVQFATNKKVSSNFGGNGGSLHKIQIPQGSNLLGFYGNVGDWVDQIGIFYS
ncbi:hypothetical protein CANINC_004652 [Pichia inconspicua]|uniref:Jacalin-type lectin domain-containing protein n=1 Tax=Pichia inconspicua TaxID=52247 RepID=A0A4T0WVW5_9ASCO|nr:hypothetical protein CANINC_004652 [[Candida] inconspicua]